MLSQFARRAGSKMTKLSLGATVIYASTDEINERKQYLIDLRDKSNIDKFLAQYPSYIDTAKIKHDVSMVAAIIGGSAGAGFGFISVLATETAFPIAIGTMIVTGFVMGYIYSDDAIESSVIRNYGTYGDNFKTLAQIKRDTYRAAGEIDTLTNVEKTGEYVGTEIYQNDL